VLQATYIPLDPELRLLSEFLMCRTDKDTKQFKTGGTKLRPDAEATYHFALSSYSHIHSKWIGSDLQHVSTTQSRYEIQYISEIYQVFREMKKVPALKRPTSL